MSINNNLNIEGNYEALNRFARNLNDLAKKGKLDPVIGRDDEIRRVLNILSRRTKNNPILIGEPGTGKAAIAEGLAHRIVKGDVPENLKTRQVFSLPGQGRAQAYRLIYFPGNNRGRKDRTRQGTC